MSDADGTDWPPEHPRRRPVRVPRNEDPSADAGLVSNYDGPELPDEAAPARMTAKQYLTSRGADPSTVSRDQLLEFGRHAAKIGFGRKIPAAKVMEGQYLAHTWPVAVWQEAAKVMMGGDKPPARPASQRQVAYIVALYAASPAGRHSNPDATTWAMKMFGGVDMDEDVAAQWIKRLGGS